MAPTLATHRDGRVVALGSGGANRIRSAVSRVLDQVMLAQDTSILEAAVNAPRVHAEDERLWFEAAGWKDASTLGAPLNDAFAQVTRFETTAFFFGGVHSVAHNGHQSSGVGDSRRGGVCLTVET